MQALQQPAQNGAAILNVLAGQKPVFFVFIPWVIAIVYPVFIRSAKEARLCLIACFLMAARDYMDQTIYLKAISVTAVCESVLMMQNGCITILRTQVLKSLFSLINELVYL